MKIHTDQALLAARPRQGRPIIIATIGVAARLEADVANHNLDHLDCDLEIPMTVGFHVWSGTIADSPTVAGQSVWTGSWCWATAEDFERFGIPLPRKGESA